MNVFLKVWKLFFHYDLNLLKTLWFNLRVFGLKKGWKLPVFLYGRINLQNYYKGCITLSSYSSGSVRIGGGQKCYIHGTRALYPSIINIEGHVNIGKNVILGNGIVLGVAPQGILSLGNDLFVNVHSRIYCENRITIGDGVWTSWDVQLFDTNFHYIYKEGVVNRKNLPTQIGHHVWIGYRVTISKGAIIPDYCVVSGNSFVNKDFSSIKRGGVLSGEYLQNTYVLRLDLF